MDAILEAPEDERIHWLMTLAESLIGTGPGKADRINELVARIRNL
ncbi:hypothetical protein [Saccharospirillum mangrovi]|nr:hypothetical protein [Saccharospirillum mangrovi]